MSTNPARLGFGDAASAHVIGAVMEDGPLWTRLTDVLHGAGFTRSVRASTPAQLAEVVPEPDVVIIASQGGRSASIALVRDVRATLPADAGLVIIWDSSDARGALRAGADGVVATADVETGLIPTLTAVCSGLVCLPRRMRACIESESLSMREKQVLGMLVMGFSNAEIGRKLYLAESTVKSHLSSAYAKLGVRSRKDAAALILDPTEGLGPGILAISAA